MSEGGFHPTIDPTWKEFLRDKGGHSWSKLGEGWPFMEWTWRWVAIHGVDLDSKGKPRAKDGVWGIKATAIAIWTQWAMNEWACEAWKPKVRPLLTANGNPKRNGDGDRR